LLDLAYNHKQALNKKYSQMILDPQKYKYVISNTWATYELEIHTNSWDKLQFVSIVKKEVIGYFECSADRQVYYAHRLVAINFEDKPNFVFSKDFWRFVKLLFVQYKFNKINFSCVVGNPAEKIYYKIINKWSGRIVGTYKNDVKLLDGKVYDLRVYEIPNFIL